MANGGVIGADPSRVIVLSGADLISRAKELLRLIKDARDAAVNTTSQQAPSIVDRVAIYARLAQPYLRLVIDNPSAAALVKIGAARRLASHVWDAAQRLWFEAGNNDALAQSNAALAREISESYYSLIESIRAALNVENQWATMSANILDQGISTFFSGLAATLERWINGVANFVQNPFGLSWDLILLAGAAIVLYVLSRR